MGDGDTVQSDYGNSTEGSLTIAQQVLLCIHPARIELATFSVLG